MVGERLDRDLNLDSPREEGCRTFTFHRDLADNSGSEGLAKLWFTIILSNGKVRALKLIPVDDFRSCVPRVTITSYPERGLHLIIVVDYLIS